MVEVTACTMFDAVSIEIFHRSGLTLIDFDQMVAASASKTFC